MIEEKKPDFGECEEDKDDSDVAYAQYVYTTQEHWDYGGHDLTAEALRDNISYEASCRYAFVDIVKRISEDSDDGKRPDLDKALKLMRYFSETTLTICSNVDAVVNDLNKRGIYVADIVDGPQDYKIVKIYQKT